MKNAIGGFLLIELSIAIIVIGVLSASFFSFASIEKKKENFQKNKETIEFLQSKLSDYIKDIPDTGLPGKKEFSETRWNPANNFENDAVHYPCPAPLTAVPGDVNFGVEQRVDGKCNDSVPGVFSADGFGGKKVFIGAVPTRTLGISDEYIKNPYGFKLTYAVSDLPSRDLALKGGAIADGAITVKNKKDPSADKIKTAKFVIVSHGKDGVGAYSFASSVPYRECKKQIDKENCDNDSQFIIEPTATTNNKLRFDDTVAFSLAENGEDSNELTNILVSAREGIDFTISKIKRGEEFNILSDTYLTKSVYASGLGAGGVKQESYFIKLNPGDKFTNKNGSSDPRSANQETILVDTLKDKNGKEINIKERMIKKEEVFVAGTLLGIPPPNNSRTISGSGTEQLYNYNARFTISKKHNN